VGTTEENLMSDARQYSETEGTFRKEEESTRKCHQCDAVMTCKIWESNDGGYEDTKYTCPKGHIEWVDGIDS